MNKNSHTFIRRLPALSVLAALAISNFLKLPISGTYHTALPQYAQYLTGDPAIEELTWRYTLWYYNQMDVIYVPSHSTGEELVEKGRRSREDQVVFPEGSISIDFIRRNETGILKNNTISMQRQSFSM